MTRDIQVPGWLVHPGPWGLNPLEIAAGSALGLILVVTVFAVALRHEPGWRLRADDALTYLAAVMATSFSVDGMFRVAGERLGMHGVEQVLLCAFMEVALVACAVRARRNVKDFGREGVDGQLVWVFAVLTGIFGSSVGEGIGAAVRFIAPLVAAALWQRGLNLLRRRVRPTAQRSIAWRWTSERIAIWLGFAEPAERSTTEVARARRIARLIKTRIALAALEGEPRSALLAVLTARSIRSAVTAARLRSQTLAAVEHLRLGLEAGVMQEISTTVATVVNLPVLTDPDAVRAHQTPAPEVQQSAPGPAPLAEQTLATVTALAAHRAAPAVERPSVVSAPVPEAIEAPRPAPAAPRQKPGSTRQKVAELLADNPNATSSEIAEQIGVKRQTVDYHVAGLRKETETQ